MRARRFAKNYSSFFYEKDDEESEVSYEEKDVSHPYDWRWLSRDEEAPRLDWHWVRDTQETCSDEKEPGRSELDIERTCTCHYRFICKTLSRNSIDVEVFA